MRLTPLGFRVITIAPLVVAAVFLWAILARLPLFDGVSLLLTFAIVALVALAIHNWGWGRIEYPRTPYVARHGAHTS